MYKYFFPVLISGIGIYYYYHFKYLNNKSNLNNNSDNNSDNYSDNNSDNFSDNFSDNGGEIINDDSNSVEIINDDSNSEEIIDNSEEIIVNDEIDNLDINKLEENTTLNDMQRYQIILYKEPFIIFNNWELIN